MDKSLKKVLITDPIDKSCIEILESNNIPVDYCPKLPLAEILKKIEDADGLIVRSGTTVTTEIISAAKHLKIIGRAGVGVDNIDCDAATSRGIVVINAPSGNTLSAAEHTCAMIMSLARTVDAFICRYLLAAKFSKSPCLSELMTFIFSINTVIFLTLFTQDADGLIVRSGTTVTTEIISAAKHLKIIGRAGVGVDNIDCDAATSRGIVVINAPSGNTLSAAEHTCAMIMSLAREIPQACQTLKSEKWDRSKFMGNELFGKTLGIIGLGRIGREVAHRMQSFGMTTIGFDPLVSAAESAKFNVEWLSLDQMWPRVDFVTLHVPLIPQTKNMVNGEVLSKCKKGVRFVNVARGGIIDDDAIFQALESGQCGGLAVDVYIQEPPKEFTLIKHPKVVCTPHLGASTVEGQVKVAQEISNQFVDFVQGKSLPGAVNASAFNESLNEEFKSWANLAKALGQIAINLTSKDAKGDVRVKIVFGEDLLKMKNLLVSSALTGILGNDVGANLINVAKLANKAGIQIVPEIRTLHPGNSQIGIEIVKNEERHFIVGSTNQQQLLLIEIDSAKFEDGFPLNGIISFFKCASSEECLGSIIANLSSTVSVNLACQSSVASDVKWLLVKVSKYFQSKQDEKNFVTQIQF